MANRDILAELYDVFEKNGFHRESQEIKDAVSAGSTGGEVWDHVAFLLEKYSQENPRIAEIAGNLISEIIESRKPKGFLNKLFKS